MKMQKLKAVLKKCKKQGQSLVEYGLILALVSVVAIAVLQTMGRQIKTTINTLTNRLNQANTIAQS
jgi:Flp pilus assembly pilin Flp